MSKLQELINRLCPDGVPYKALGDVCEIKGRIGFRGYTRKDIVPENQGALSLSPSNINDFVINYDNSTFISWNKYEESPEIKIEENDVIFTKTASVGKCAIIKNLPCPATINPQLVVLKKIKINPDFLNYILQNSSFQVEVKKLTGIGSVPNISQIALSSIPIPVPPIEVQEEIVKILDRFSDYAAELQAELQARKEQYEYYRNLLLTFNPSACGFGTDGEQENSVTTWGGHSYKIQWVTFNEVFEMRNGYTPSKSNLSFWEGGTIPWFRMEDIRENGRILKNSFQHITNSAIKGKGLFKANSFILATTATIGEHALLLVDSLANQQFTNLLVRDALESKLLTRFVYFYLFIVDDFCKNNTNVSGFASVDMEKLKKMPFPIPPLELQEKIVAILDRFETLVNDLAEGLPAEIEAVREQYEYYRNKLLTFKQLA